MSAQKKLEALRAVEGADLPVRDALARLEMSPSTYYSWRRRFIDKMEVDATHCRVHYNLRNLTAHLAPGSFQVGSLASPRNTGDEPLLTATSLKVA